MATSSFASAGTWQANDRLGDRPHAGPNHSIATDDRAARLRRQRIQCDGRRRKARPGANRQRGVTTFGGSLHRRKLHLLTQKASGENWPN